LLIEAANLTFFAPLPHPLQPSVEDPDATSWTLRLKHHKTTVLLFATGQTPFGAIKQDLLSMLAVTHGSRSSSNGGSGAGTLNGHAIPTDPADVVLGVPKDANDLQSGWKTLKVLDAAAVEYDAAAAADGSSSRKKRRLGRGRDSGLDCPQGAGLRDGAVLAFKFRNRGAAAAAATTATRDAGRTRGGDDDDDDGEEEGAEEEEEDEDEEWDVVVPSYDDEYGGSSQVKDEPSQSQRR
jgi:hypothetical protein